MLEAEEVMSRLTEVFQDVFEDDELELTRDMTADDVEEWDSLSHITLVMAAEREFKFKMSAAQIGALKNVGEMIDLIAERGA